MKDTMIDVDVAKNVFHIQAASLTGEWLFRQKVRRPQFLKAPRSKARQKTAFDHSFNRSETSRITDGNHRRLSFGLYREVEGSNTA